ncbi:MAG TPA: hypothetical protein VHY34_12220 [Caulobacteraceae bacterium]|jgi:hypothetical protein|nr:hypothetical protein [Caulobacteraceae bacterium]
MSRISCVLAVAGAAAALAGPAVAQQSWFAPDRFALGLGIGTNGAVVEGAYLLTPKLVLRGQGAFIGFEANLRSGDAKYSARPRFDTGGAFLDWHPWSNAIMLSAGVVAGQRKADLNLKPNGPTIKLGGVSFAASQIGQVNGVTDFGDAAPFFGLGWDGAFTASGRIGLRLIAGVIFGNGDPGVKLHVTGPLQGDPGVMAALAVEQSALQHDAQTYSYYPVAQASLSYRF